MDNKAQLHCSQQDDCEKDVQTVETANDANYKLQGIYTKKEFSKDTDKQLLHREGRQADEPSQAVG